MASSVRWILFLTLLAFISAEDNSFEGCLRKDSISCVQNHVFRKLRAIFGQETINLVGGFQLVKSEGSRSIDDDGADENVSNSNVADRQLQLDDFVYNRISNFFSERKLKWSLTPAIAQVAATARMAVTSIPSSFKEKLATFIVEGRGKKKVIKALAPLLIFAKLKLTTLFGLGYLVTAVIAKKALVAGTIALAITLYISLKKLLAKHHTPILYEVHSEPIHHSAPSHHDRSGWAPQPQWTSWDSYDPSVSSHHLAYGSPNAALR